MTALKGTLPWDWYSGTIPDNAIIDETAYVETTYSFNLYRSHAPVGLQIGKGSSIYLGTMFDVGTYGQVSLGNYSLMNSVRIICDEEIKIGDYALISWNVVLMDTYRVPFNPVERRKELVRIPKRKLRNIDAKHSARPIHIGANVWIGFDACVLPGVTIGEGSIIGARSVVTTDVAPYTIAAGNPARVIRHLEA
ncbi:MAG: acyltransferase [Acidobacteria bacterium]|jgi:acetyltransferase-like isoleucine patch superfamily enzyme|nr:acyltransferase [Acidobacteriota bacterium]MBA4182601.1 acyltransferase [Acidobacteriota bacterium]